MSCQILAKPIDGETIRGTIGRAAIVHGVSGREMCSFLTKRESSYISIEPIAHAFNLTREQIVWRHTTLPFFKRFGVELSQDQRSTEAFSNSFSELTKLRKPFYFCTHCTQEDIHRRGFSIWRTVHQLPGVHLCIKHRVQLTATDCTPLNSCPHQTPEYAIADEAPRASTSTKFASIRLLYAQLARQMLIRRAVGPPASVVMYRFRNRAKALGITHRTAPSRTRPTLSEYAHDRASAADIEDLLLNTGRISRDHKSALNWSLYPGYRACKVSSALLCTLAVMLYDEDVESALRPLTAAPTRQELAQCA